MRSLDHALFLDGGIMRGGVDEQGHLAGTLDFAGQQTLMVRAGTGDAAGDDLAAFGDEVAQDVRALVVQGRSLSAQKRQNLRRGANFFLKAITRPPLLQPV